MVMKLCSQPCPPLRARNINILARTCAGGTNVRPNPRHRLALTCSPSVEYQHDEPPARRSGRKTRRPIGLRRRGCERPDTLPPHFGPLAGEHPIDIQQRRPGADRQRFPSVRPAHARPRPSTHHRKRAPAREYLSLMPCKPPTVSTSLNTIWWPTLLGTCKGLPGESPKSIPRSGAKLDRSFAPKLAYWSPSAQMKKLSVYKFGRQCGLPAGSGVTKNTDEDADRATLADSAMPPNTRRRSLAAYY